MNIQRGEHNLLDWHFVKKHFFLVYIKYNSYKSITLVDRKDIWFNWFV